MPNRFMRRRISELSGMYRTKAFFTPHPAPFMKACIRTIPA